MKTGPVFLIFDHMSCPNLDWGNTLTEISCHIPPFLQANFRQLPDIRPQTLFSPPFLLHSVIILPFDLLQLSLSYTLYNSVCATENYVNPLNPELNPICYLLALLGAHHFLHISRIRVKSLTFRRLMSYIYGAPILDVSRSHTTTQHSR